MACGVGKPIQHRHAPLGSPEDMICLIGLGVLLVGTQKTTVVPNT